jgi:spore germination cell wall hydrolase CwlJ-like protein
MIADTFANFVIAWVLATSPAPIETSLNEYLCMLEAVHFESRGEGYMGKVGVANVLMNRVKNQRYFPNTVCGNVNKHAAFEYKLKGLKTIRLTNPKEKESFIESAKIAFQAVQGELPDITGGADHFFNPSVTRPDWERAALSKIDIYNHRFVNLYNPDALSHH